VNDHRVPLSCLTTSVSMVKVSPRLAHIIYAHLRSEMSIYLKRLYG
jgi:hypothetical protein